MPDRMVAVCLWLLAWFAVSIVAAVAWATLRGRTHPAPAALTAACAGAAAGVLVYGGTVLW